MQVTQILQTRNSKFLSLRNPLGTKMKAYIPIKTQTTSENCLFSTWCSPLLPKLNFHLSQWQNLRHANEKRWASHPIHSYFSVLKCYSENSDHLHVSDRRQYVLSCNSPSASPCFCLASLSLPLDKWLAPGCSLEDFIGQNVIYGLNESKVKQLVFHWLVIKAKLHTFFDLKVSPTTASVCDFA
jgi:hypothetical protein